MMLFFVLVVMLASVVDMARVCDNGWMPYNNYCYRFSVSQLPFRSAISTCIRSGSNLIELSGKTEENWMNLQTRIRGYRLMWIGLTDELREGQYVYPSSGGKPTYTNWERGQPQRGRRENCAAMDITSLKWHDYPCGRKMHFICKKPANHYA